MTPASWGKSTELYPVLMDGSYTWPTRPMNGRLPAKRVPLQIEFAWFLMGYNRV